MNGDLQQSLTNVLSLLETENQLLVAGKTTAALELHSQKKAAITALETMRVPAEHSSIDTIDDETKVELETTIQKITATAAMNAELLDAALATQREIIAILTTRTDSSQAYGALGTYRRDGPHSSNYASRGLNIPPA